MVLSDARSEPESGSEKPWHHAISPFRIFGQEVLLLLLGAVLQDGRADERVAEEVGAQRRLGPGELLGQDDVLHGRQALAAVLLGPRGADPAAVVELRRPLLVERLLLLGRQLEALVEPAVGEVLLEPGPDLGAELLGLGRVASDPCRHLDPPVKIAVESVAPAREASASRSGGDHEVVRGRPRRAPSPSAARPLEVGSAPAASTRRVMSRYRAAANSPRAVGGGDARVGTRLQQHLGGRAAPLLAAYVSGVDALLVDDAADAPRSRTCRPRRQAGRRGRTPSDGDASGNGVRPTCWSGRTRSADRRRRSAGAPAPAVAPAPSMRTAAARIDQRLELRVGRSAAVIHPTRRPDDRRSLPRAMACTSEHGALGHRADGGTSAPEHEARVARRRADPYDAAMSLTEEAPTGRTRAGSGRRPAGRALDRASGRSSTTRSSTPACAPGARAA